MVVHDLRNPAESICEGLKQVSEMKKTTFTNLMESSQTYIKENIIQQREQQDDPLQNNAP